MIDINVDVLQRFIMFLKNSTGAIKNEITSNKKLAEVLLKPAIEKFGKRKVHSFFIDNIWVLILQICS